ncbi:hypothetical protein [Cohnella caldifontis]|uniref:hypothetical protein n=1 Tax=Cohnella caldifontis TaxID=3027471 RepID=UPI0023EC0332|nr:hypothetical protein [Cohnella sp. YIM B05605]
MCLILLCAGCASSPESSKPEPGTPSVTSDQAAEAEPRPLQSVFDGAQAIPSDLLASEKTLPPDFDRIAFTRPTVPHYEYVVSRADDEQGMKRLWSDFGLATKVPTVDFEHKRVYFIGVRESGTCPYRLAGPSLSPEGTSLIFGLTGAEGVCTADATPRTFVVAADHSDVEDVTEAVLAEGETVTSVPIRRWSSEYSLQIGDGYLALRDGGDRADAMLGALASRQVEKLENADTYTGSWIERRTYDGLKMELFSPKQDGKTFWIMTMEVSKKGYPTSKGIEIGDTLEQLKKAYPGIEMANDGRTDPINAAYEIHDRDRFNFLSFEIVDGTVTGIKIYNLLP